MSDFKIKYLTISLCSAFCLLINSGYSNPPSSSDQSKVYFSARTGFAWLQHELGPQFSLFENEFSHHTGSVFDISLSKVISDRFEFGLNFDTYHLSGWSENTDFWAANIHYALRNLYQEPVMYNTQSYNYLFFGRYYLRSLSDKIKSKTRWFPYVEVGIGENIFSTELKYEILPEGASSLIVFSKGKNSEPRLANVIQYSVGAGARINYNEKLDLLLSLNTDMVRYDCMDALHNYDRDLKDVKTTAIVPKFLIGVSIPINRKRAKKIEYLPWAP